MQKLNTCIILLHYIHITKTGFVLKYHILNACMILRNFHIVHACIILLHAWS